MYSPDDEFQESESAVKRGLIAKKEKNTAIAEEDAPSRACRLQRKG